MGQMGMTRQWLEEWKQREDCRIKRNGHHHVNEERLVCPYGNCTVEVCEHCRKISGAFGPVGCPCDNTPGWRSKRYDGMGKPRVPVLAKGRKTSRVQRSVKRHEPPEWLSKWPFTDL